MASVEHRVPAAHAGHGGVIALGRFAASRLNCVLHQQDGVLGGDAHEHDETNQRRHGKALIRDQQAHKRATQRQRQRRQNRDGVQEAFEQQHQHDVDAQHADHHGQAKAGKEFAHDFGVAHFDHLHARGQALQCGQLLHGLRHVAQRHARELDFEVDVALAVVAVNHGRAARHLDAGHLAQHDGATAAGHHQALERGQVLPGCVAQFHDDGHLALRQIELGQGGIVVAQSGHTQGVADCGAGHAQVGGFGKVGAHCDLGAHQAGRRCDRAQA